MQVGVKLATVLLLVFALEQGQTSVQQRVQTIIPPGYQPVAADEKGLWLEMAEAEAELTKSPLLVTNRALTEYVSKVACAVAQEYCADIRVFIMSDPAFNAAMGPNGTMLINTGALVRIESPDQLAAVIAHELAHYTQAHSLRILQSARRRMAVASILSAGLGAATIGAGLPELIFAVSVINYSRKQELAADKLSLQFMQASGYDPSAAITVWQYLEEEEAAASAKQKKRSIFFSSHPRTEVRKAKLENLLNSATDPSAAAASNFVGVVQANYDQLMQEQLQSRDFGRISTLINRHESMGINLGDIAFYRGAARRIRAKEGDDAVAIKQYLLAAKHGKARAHRELGYLFNKAGNIAAAQHHFGQFLQHEPNATDRRMIRFYMQEQP